jgi:hypothetical protein
MKNATFPTRAECAPVNRLQARGGWLALSSRILRTKMPFGYWQNTGTESAHLMMIYRVLLQLSSPVFIQRRELPSSR